MYNEHSQHPIENTTVQVASNPCYAMSYNPQKNRIYFTIKGFWKSKESVPEFLNDWVRALQLVSPKFTVLTDMSSMITHPQELKEVHAQAHKLVMDGGVAYVGHVMPTDKIASLQAKAIAEQTHMAIKCFDTIAEAEEWFDKATPEAQSNL